jgi:hypothetical protein
MPAWLPVTPIIRPEKIDIFKQWFVTFNLIMML